MIDFICVIQGGFGGIGRRLQDDGSPILFQKGCDLAGKKEPQIGIGCLIFGETGNRTIEPFTGATQCIEDRIRTNSTVLYALNAKVMVRGYCHNPATQFSLEHLHYGLLVVFLPQKVIKDAEEGVPTIKGDPVNQGLPRLLKDVREWKLGDDRRGYVDD